MSFTIAQVHATRKTRDSWWTVYVVDPLACPLTLLVANRTRLTPNDVTVVSLLLGAASAVAFGVDQLVLGAVFFYLSFMVDCVDGKLARLKGTGTPFGLWLDYVGDRIRVVLCAAGLAYGQYTLTGEVGYIVLGATVAILDLFRYVNAPQMKRVREAVRELRGPREPQAEPRQPSRRVLPRVNRLLARHRVRSHLISGIEFHAAVFVVAPLVGPAALIPVATVASLLLLANEIFIVYRMWLFTRRALAQPRESREHALIGG
ncbi:CDP-alcohol phosphatidyltransferase family protein [Nonomuraea sp. NPDC050310]|uniref:CDP-alcohol phosphatidyltransferase family protein n=1 Tax=unclassified Nonomuraea TaxID=2593643 RepID=UPI0033EBA927